MKVKKIIILGSMTTDPAPPSIITHLLEELQKTKEKGAFIFDIMSNGSLNLIEYKNILENTVNIAESYIKNGLNKYFENSSHLALPFVPKEKIKPLEKEVNFIKSHASTNSEAYLLQVDYIEGFERLKDEVQLLNKVCEEDIFTIIFNKPFLKDSQQLCAYAQIVAEFLNDKYLTNKGSNVDIFVFHTGIIIIPMITAALKALKGAQENFEVIPSVIYSKYIDEEKFSNFKEIGEKSCKIHFSEKVSPEVNYYLFEEDKMNGEFHNENFENVVIGTLFNDLTLTNDL